MLLQPGNQFKNKIALVWPAFEALVCLCRVDEWSKLLGQFWRFCPK